MKRLIVSVLLLCGVFMHVKAYNCANGVKLVGTGSVYFTSVNISTNQNNFIRVDCRTVGDFEITNSGDASTPFKVTVTCEGSTVSKGYTIGACGWFSGPDRKTGQLAAVATLQYPGRGTKLSGTMSGPGGLAVSCSHTL